MSVEDELRRAAGDLGRSGGSAGVRLTIVDDSPAGDRGVDRIFVGLGATLDAFPEALRAAIPAIRLAHAANFRTQGASGRGAWEPLSRRTIRERLRLGYGAGPALTRTGDLRRHVLGTPAQITTTADGAELRIAPDPTVEGTGKAYYRAQALGRPEANLPSRPMVTVGPEGAVAITSAVSRALRTIAQRNGL